MSLPKKKFGSKSIKREAEILVSLLFFFMIAVFGIYFAIKSQGINFDLRNDAAGNTIFLSSGDDLQAALDRAGTSDAIFLKVGEYTAKTNEGFSIKNKDIRILGAGSDFVDVVGTGKTNVFHVENASVRFEDISISGANDSGILIDNANTKEVQFKNVEIKNNSGAGIKTDSKTVVQASTIDHNAYGIKSGSGELVVENSVVNGSTYSGINILNTSTANTRIQNSVITRNTEKGILFEGGSEHTVKNVTLSGNGDGIVETGSSLTTVTNSIVQGSKNQGISLKSGSKVTYTSSSTNGQSNFTPAALQSSEGNLTTKADFDDVFRLVSGSPLKDKGSVAEKDQDGSRIDMGAFGGNPYIIALNSKPTISSTPPYFVKVGEKYNYQILASDPDNDALTYAVINKNAPKWVKLNGSTVSGTPGPGDVGFGGVMVVVSDKHGHNIVHPVSINVIPVNRVTEPKPTATTTTAPTTSSTVTKTPTPVVTTTTQATPTPTSNSEVPKVTFISPAEGASFQKGNIEIKWELTNAKNVESLVLKYSEDNENFNAITTVPPTQSSYTWDAKNIPTGTYVLQIEAKEKGTNPLTVAEISNEFELKDVPQNVNTGDLTITKISPAENDVVSDFKPLIFVEFKPDVDIDKTKTFIKANGEDLAYKFTKNTIYYEPTDSFLGNKVVIEAKIVSTSGAEASKKWTFSLPAEANPNKNTNPQQTKTQKILGLPKPIGLVVLGVLILGLLILILYFVVKLLKTLREERQGSLEAEFIEYYDSPLKSSQPEQTASMPQQPAPQMPVQDMNEYLAMPEPQTAQNIQQSLTPEPTLETAQTPVDLQTNTAMPDMTANVQQAVQPEPQNVAPDPYIEELKKKYGIDGQSGQPGQSQPDPNQAPPTTPAA